MAIDYKEVCSFCGKQKEGTHRFINGITDKMVCWDCIRLLKETLDDINTLKMAKQKPSEHERCD